MRRSRARHATLRLGRDACLELGVGFQQPSEVSPVQLQQRDIGYRHDGCRPLVGLEQGQLAEQTPLPQSDRNGLRLYFHASRHDEEHARGVLIPGEYDVFRRVGAWTQRVGDSGDLSSAEMGKEWHVGCQIPGDDEVLAFGEAEKLLPSASARRADLEDYLQDDGVTRLRSTTSGIDQLASGTVAL